MSSRSIQIIGGPDRETAWVDAAKHALQVTGDLTIGSLKIGDAVAADEMVTVMGMMRDDALSALPDPEGDAQIARCNANGALWVTIDGGISVGSLNIGEAVGATENVMALGLQRDDVLATLSDPDGDAQIGRCNSRGALWVALDGTSSLEVTQDTHDDLNANANIQVGNADVANGNPVPVSDAGGSLTIDGTVAATQSGSWTVSVTEPVSVDDNGGSLTVDGTVAVSNFPASQAVNDGGGSLTIDDGGGSITIDGTVTATIAEPVEVDTAFLVDSVAGATAPVFPAGAIRDDVLTTLTPVDGDYVNLRVNSDGALWVTAMGAITIAEPVSVDDNGGSLTVDGTVAVSSVAGTVTIVDGGGSITIDGTVSVTEPVSVDDNGGSLTVDGTVAVSSVGGTVTVAVSGTVVVVDGGGSISVDDNGGSLTIDGTVTATTALLVDSAAGATGVVFPAGAVRDDALTTLTPADGDYVNLRTDSLGALWVRERGDIVNVIVLSGSTDGAPIRITATTLGGANAVHTASATAGVADRVSLYASNIGGGGTITLTLATTDGGADSEVKYEVMSEQTIYLGIFTIEDSEALIAYASTANFTRIFGEVIRHTA